MGLTSSTCTMPPTLPEGSDNISTNSPQTVPDQQHPSNLQHSFNQNEDLEVEENFSKNTRENEPESSDDESDKKEKSPKASEKINLDEKKNKQVSATLPNRATNPQMLNPKPMQVLLDQANMVEKNVGIQKACFSKILLSSRSFVNVARRFKCYRFEVEVRDINFGINFKNVVGSNAPIVSVDFERLRRLVQLLDPLFVYASVYRKPLQELNDLLLLTTGKIGAWFPFDNDMAETFVQIYQLRLVELECNAALLSNLPQLNLEKLEVCHIENKGQLRNALRHNVKKLTLDFAYDYIDDRAPIEEVGRIENCTFTAAASTASTFTQTLLVNCPTLKTLGVQGCEYSEFGTELAGEIVEEIVRVHDVYTQLIQMLSQKSTKSTVEISADYWCKTLPDNWMNSLLTRNKFSSVKHETTVDDYEGAVTKFTAEQSHPKVNAKFVVELRCNNSESDNSADEFDREDLGADDLSDFGQEIEGF